MSEVRNKDELKSILEQHESWIKSMGGKRADLRDANLQGADLRWANLQHADLRGANLQRADLRWANLQQADLRDANLQGADLRDANLQHADLRGANLQRADLDYSCLPLWCGSKKMKVDKRIASQIAAHFCALDCDDEDYQAARTAILEFAKTSHRADDLGLVVEREE
jgi:uncharacterized protein YjbI with pentapeptide repeats